MYSDLEEQWVAPRLYLLVMLEAMLHHKKYSPTRLYKQELNKNKHRYVKVEGGKTIRPQTYTKIMRQLGDTDYMGNSLPKEVDTDGFSNTKQ